LEQKRKQDEDELIGESSIMSENFNIGSMRLLIHKMNESQLLPELLLAALME
jgi:hypothetical protein